MEPPHYGVQRDARKSGACVLHDVDDAGMRACSEHDDSLALDVRRNVALIHNPRIRFPRASVSRALHVTDQSALVGCNARDLSTEVKQVLQQQTRLRRINDGSSGATECLDAWNVFERNVAAVGESDRSAQKHTRFDVAGHGLAAIRGNDRVDRLDETPSMVPVTVGKHDCPNVSKRDLEAIAVTTNRVSLRACVKEKNVM